MTKPNEDAAQTFTIYVCPVCDTWDMDEHYTGGHDFDRFPNCHLNQRVAVQTKAVTEPWERQNVEIEVWPQDYENFHAWARDGGYTFVSAAFAFHELLREAGISDDC